MASSSLSPALLPRRLCPPLPGRCGRVGQAAGSCPQDVPAPRHCCALLPLPPRWRLRQRRPQAWPGRQAGALQQPCQRLQCRAAAPSEAAPVGVAQAGLLFPRGTAGAWDEGGVGNPVVRCYLGDNEQRWYMWYTGRAAGDRAVDAWAPASGSAGVATSADGLAWQRSAADVAGERGAAKDADVGRVLAPNGDWWTFDTCHLSVSDVQILSNSGGGGGGVYWMFYAGGDFQPVAAPRGLAGLPAGAEVEGLRMRPGLAMSQDARNWARIEADHHTGALFDAGEEGEWDELFVAAPQVVAASPKDMRMYYHSFDVRRQKYVVGLATSEDGFRWSKQGSTFEGSGAAFDARGVAARHVVKDVAARRYVMFYEAVAEDDRRCISAAVSPDGLRDWRPLGRPVLTASDADGAWDGGGVGAPWAVPMAGGRWRLYYAGRADKGETGPSARAAPWEGIGLALTKDDGEQLEGVPVSYGRWTAAARL